MNDAESSGPNQEQLDDLEGEIQQARHRLNEETHEEPEAHEFFEDDQSRPEDEGDGEGEAEGQAPGNDNVPA